MRINTNIMAINTHRNLGINGASQAKSTEKLSSGLRINRAADDAAGLAISEKMRAQIRGLTRASANAQDGISLIQAAEGALQETHSILQRMRELAVQAANDVNETLDRKAIQDEINQLVKETDRIAFTTEFNKKTLLDGSLQFGNQSAKVVSGAGIATGITTVPGTTTAGMYGIEVTKLGVEATASFTIDMSKAVEGETITISLGADFKVNGTTLLAKGNVAIYQAAGNVDKDNATGVNMLKDALQQALGDYYDISSVDNKITVTAKQAVDTIYDAVKDAAFAVATKKVDGTAGTAVTGAAVAATANVKGVSAEVSVTTPTAAASTAKAGAKYGTFTHAASGLSFTINDVTRYAASVVQVNAGQDLTLQVGANSNIDQTIAISVRSLSAASLGIDNLSVHSNEAGRASLAAIDTALNIVSDQRAALGAVQNRLEHTVANLDTVAENLTSAESRIRDTDMAKEMMNFTRSNILQQAATAMLAQANQVPQTVLQLLR